MNKEKSQKTKKCPPKLESKYLINLHCSFSSLIQSRSNQKTPLSKTKKKKKIKEEFFFYFFD